MKTLYKLTDEMDKTKNSVKWAEGVTNTAFGPSNELCTSGVIHAYESPLLAVFMDPAHAKYLPFGHLWLAKGEIVASDGLKIGCKSLTTLNRIEVPLVTMGQRVAFGILCAKQVCRDKGWNKWADAWLSGEDRSKKRAEGVAADAKGMARVAEDALWPEKELMWRSATMAANAAVAAIVAMKMRKGWRKAVREAAETAIFTVEVGVAKTADVAAGLEEEINFSTLAEQAIKVS